MALLQPQARVELVLPSCLYPTRQMAKKPPVPWDVKSGLLRPRSKAPSWIFPMDQPQGWFGTPRVLRGDPRKPQVGPSLE